MVFVREDPGASSAVYRDRVDDNRVRQFRRHERHRPDRDALPGVNRQLIIELQLVRRQR